MKKLSEYKDDEALDLLAEMLEPCVEVFSDKELVTLIRTDTKMKAIQYAIKHHKREIVEIMAILNGVPVENFHYNVFTLPKMIVEVLNDKDLVDFFHSQGQMASQNDFGSATENTMGEGE